MKTFLRQLTPVALLAVISIAACGTASAANTWVVTSTADDGGPDTLGYAIGWAQDGDTIVFDSSLNGKTIYLSDGYELYIGQTLIHPDLKNLTIAGPGSDKLTIAGRGTRVFEVGYGVQVTISGLSIIDGYPYSFNAMGDTIYGGAILNEGNLTLNDCIVADSRADSGGGILNFRTMTINDSIVTGNIAAQAAGGGGGIMNWSTGTMTINRSSVFNNISFDGSGNPVVDNIKNYGTLKIHHSYVPKK